MVGDAGLGNHRARTGHSGHVRAGQAWAGERYPTGPLILAGAAGDLAGSGVVLRWAGSAADTLAGRLLLVALFGTGVSGLWQLVSWARARAQITVWLNRVTVLISPVLGWPDLRAGRVTAQRCRFPRRNAAFPSILTLLYSQRPRNQRRHRR